MTALEASRGAPELVPAPEDSRFTRRAEREFRAWFYASQIRRAQVSLPLAQLLVFISVGLDILGADSFGARAAALVKLLLICPLLLATQWASRQERWQRHYPYFMCASVVAVGAAFSIVNIGGQDFGLGVRYDALMLVTVFTYFLGGLASRLACLTGLSLLAMHVASAALREAPLAQLAYETLFLAAVNAIGMFSASMSERSVRDAFWRFQTVTQLSELDPLTHLLNRRGFDRRYAELWEQNQLERKTLALAFVDVDHFKSINDRYGHDVGDAALRAIAAVLSGSDPPPALCARLGGDELVAVWSGLDRARAGVVAARIPRAVAAVALPGAPAGALTVSVGLSVCHPAPSVLPGECLRRADEALYEAKQQGRNRCVAD